MASTSLQFSDTLNTPALPFGSSYLTQGTAIPAGAEVSRVNIQIWLDTDYSTSIGIRNVSGEFWLWLDYTGGSMSVHDSSNSYIDAVEDTYTAFLFS
jgi:hypothetical protein